MSDLFFSGAGSDCDSLLGSSSGGEEEEEEIVALSPDRDPDGTDLPLYTHCDRLTGVQGADGCYLTCLSVFRELGKHESSIYLGQRFRAAAKKGLSVVLHRLIPNTEWNKDESKWELLTAEESEWCVALKDLPEFVRWALARTRKTREAKKRLLTKFHVEINDEEDIPVPIECEVLDLLERCIPFKMELQYRVGKNRLDAFIPRLRLAVQIDEHGHKNYPENEEKEYDEVLRDHNIVVIRFNPHAHPPTELVKQVWERTISPDFVSFREKLRLV